MHSTDVSGLNQRFGIPGALYFREDPSGLIVAEVDIPDARATIALQGAHVMTWTPAGQAPVIWLSPVAKLAPGKSIRGGVPVCWPWFGPHASQPSFPAHGYARAVPWQVLACERHDDGPMRMGFRLVTGEKTVEQWPHQTPVELSLTIGKTLDIALTTQNLGPTPVTVGQALHTYFTVSDIREVTVMGLDGCPYVDKVDGGKRKQQSGPVRFEGETDRIYLDSTADCLIDDPGLDRRIRIAKTGSRSTVVWNPWIEKAERMGDLGPDGYLRMVCVESANADEDGVTIPPGGEHRLWVRYSVEAGSSAN
jgi:glucose-6-phosphate 1-epimerase